MPRHAALKRLQVDYLDLYFCHRPDIDTPIEETVRAMHNLIVQGKVLYWGTSEWTAQQLTEAYAAARQFNLTPPTMEQPEYNLFRREKVESEFLPLYELFGLGTTIWSPLASGILTGKYNDGIPADSRMNLPGYEWLKARLDSDKGKSELAKVQAARGAGQGGRAADPPPGAALVPRQPARLDGDPRRQQAEPAQGQPRGAQAPGQADAGRAGPDRGDRRQQAGGPARY